MTPRELIYAGRLPRPCRGENLLDVTEAAPRRLVAEATDPTPAVWVPWCPQCCQEPVGGPWPLQGAEYLARQHDAVHHGGSWMARAVPQADLARLQAVAAEIAQARAAVLSASRAERLQTLPGGAR